MTSEAEWSQNQPAVLDALQAYDNFQSKQNAPEKFMSLNTAEEPDESSQDTVDSKVLRFSIFDAVQVLIFPH